MLPQPSEYLRHRHMLHTQLCKVPEASSQAAVNHSDPEPAGVGSVTVYSHTPSFWLWDDPAACRRQFELVRELEDKKERSVHIVHLPHTHV